MAEAVWREARRVRPGWYVRMEGDWHEVTTCLSGIDTLTRERFAEVITVDGFVARAAATFEIATLTALEAKRAGVTA